jgi:hypothetical protein
VSVVFASNRSHYLGISVEVTFSEYHPVSAVRKSESATIRMSPAVPVALGISCRLLTEKFRL